MNNAKRKSWTYKDDKELINFSNEGRSVKWMANYFQSSEGSIYSRSSIFREAGMIKGSGFAKHAQFEDETIKEMADAVKRFDKISHIPDEWIEGWAAQSRGANILSVVNYLKKEYEKHRS